MTYDARAAAVTKCILYAQDRVENMRASGDKANLRSAQLSVSIEIGIAIFSNILKIWIPPLHPISCYYTTFFYSFACTKMSSQSKRSYEEEPKEYFMKSVVIIIPLVTQTHDVVMFLKTLDIFSYIDSMLKKSSSQILSLWILWFNA